MPTSQILASGTSAARSSTLDLSDGASQTLVMRAAGQGVLSVQIQGSDSSWVTIGYLDSQYPSKQVTGPGVFSVYRDASAVEVAADAAS
jgi:hypothetical protein